MTQEDKQLLLNDISARLPYGVKVKYIYWDEDKGCEYPVPMILDDINSDGYIRFHGDIEEGEGRGYILTYLPYLRPMSNITYEERKESAQFEMDYLGPLGFDWNLLISNSSALLDWLNAHHFDYRGLIPIGLALEAPKDMYKTK